jgi:exodeoxyribonuclease VII small subunit
MTTDEQPTTLPGGAGTGGSRSLRGDGDGDSDAGAGRTFEELMEELEAITEKLAAGDLGIEAAADLYERAEKLHAQAAERLDAVRARVERLAAPAP